MPTTASTVRTYRAVLFQADHSNIPKIFAAERQTAPNDRRLQVGGSLLEEGSGPQNFNHILGLLANTDERWDERFTIIGETTTRQFCEAIEADNKNPDTPPVLRALLAHCALNAALDNTLPLPATSTSAVHLDGIL